MQCRVLRLAVVYYVGQASVGSDFEYFGGEEREGGEGGGRCVLDESLLLAAGRRKEVFGVFVFG